MVTDAPGNIDPSLVEKQKQLKRARIADAISDHLCQRPGPLELVRANILHASEDIEKAVKGKSSCFLLDIVNESDLFIIWCNCITVHN